MLGYNAILLKDYGMLLKGLKLWNRTIGQPSTTEPLSVATVWKIDRKGPEWVLGTSQPSLGLQD